MNPREQRWEAAHSYQTAPTEKAALCGFFFVHCNQRVFVFNLINVHVSSVKWFLTDKNPIKFSTLDI